MKKVLVELYVPIIGKSYDVFIPNTSPMSQVTELLKKAAQELSGGRFIPTEESAVCYRENGSVLNVNMTVYELGIHNGSKLMLI